MRVGYLQLDGWEGRTQQAVEVIGKTPKRTRIRAIKRTRLAGRMRYLEPGETTLIPHRAVTDQPVPNVEICTN